MELSFGARLRAQRERRQVTLAAIAEQSKIKLALLEGLERDDLSHWPGGVFRRAHFRDYARAIGIDVEPALQEFLARYPDPTAQSEAVTALARQAEADAVRRRPPTRLQQLVGSAISALPSLRPERRVREPQRVPVADEIQHSTFSDDVLATADDDRSRLDDPDIEAAPLDFDAPASPDSTPAIAEPIMASPSGDEERLAPAAPAPESVSVPETPVHADAAVSAPPELDTSGQPETPPPAPAAGEAGRAAAPPTEASHAAPHSEGPQAQPWKGGVDFTEVARIAMGLARVADAQALTSLMRAAAVALQARGLIVWAWDSRTGVLWPLLCHGYREELLAQLPRVPRDADNAIAAAFRTFHIQVVEGEAGGDGALVAPLLSTQGCAGVLSLELQGGREQNDAVRAGATIVAAQLSTLIGGAGL